MNGHRYPYPVTNPCPPVLQGVPLVSRCQIVPKCIGAPFLVPLTARTDARDRDGGAQVQRLRTSTPRYGTRSQPLPLRSTIAITFFYCFNFCAAASAWPSFPLLPSLRICSSQSQFTERSPLVARSTCPLSSQIGM